MKSDIGAAVELSLKHKLFIFMLAFSLRAAYVALESVFNIVDGSLFAADSFLYLKLASGIYDGNGMTIDGRATAFVSPGFPLFLAGCLAVFGSNLIWTSLLQCVLSALGCVFIAQSTALIFGSKTGFAAGIIASLYYELILWASGQILTEPLYTFFLAAGFLALVSAMSKPALSRFAIGGILFGLAALIRPTAFAGGIILGILILTGAFISRKQNIRPQYGGIFLAAMLLILLPWGLRNYFVLNYFTVLSTESGHVFWLGNNPEYDRFEHPDMVRFAGYTTMFKPPPDLQRELENKSEVEKNQILANRARQHIINHPGLFLRRAAHKTWNMWRLTFGVASWRNLLISGVSYLPLLLLSILGLYWSLRRINWREELTHPVVLLSSFILLHLFIHATITGEIRFRVPLWTALIPFAAHALWTIKDKARHQKS